jgi:probable phosphomutase (TIGR03848 family)
MYMAWSTITRPICHSTPQAHTETCRYGDGVPTVLLVRHGRTTANASGVLAGWLPGVNLDEVGREQADAVGRRLREAGLAPVRLVSSPLPRCVETAERILAFGEAQADTDAEAGTEAGGIPLDVDERLGECRYGAWTGRPLAELAKEPLWRVVQDHPSAAAFPPGEGESAGMPGESIAAMSARAVAAIREIDAEVAAAHGPEAIWVAVSHGDVIKAILADAAGSHLDLFQRIVVDPASVSVVRFTSSRPFVVRTNDIGGSLAGLVPPPAAAASGDAAVGGGAGADAGPGGGAVDEPVPPSG